MTNILEKLEETEDDANLVFLNAEVRRLNAENERLQKTYDSSKDTLLHIRRVSELLHNVIADFAERASVHDASKLKSPEKELFDEYTPLLKNTTYGSEKYNIFKEEMKSGLDHHYKNNSHHPEHYANGIDDMNLLDIIEMLADWKAATERHADGDIKKSLEINRERFKISDQLYKIILNTVKYLEQGSKYESL